MASSAPLGDASGDKGGLINWLDSPEMQELRNAWQSMEHQQAAEDQAWWDSLDYKDKAQAFRQICKLMHKAEVKDKGSYRWAMNIFDLDYGDGLNHYMTLHNLISQGLDLQESYAPCTKNTMDDTEECDTSKDVPLASSLLRIKLDQ